jgi:cation:H+ antiporter
MVALWIPAILAALALALLGSRQTLQAAQELAAQLGMSPFLIGMTVVAFGTDLPEIANSITASATDHGDINVGDSIGSVVTQMTLVLGILCLVSTIPRNFRQVGTAGFVTVLSILIGAMLLSDGYISRYDGLTLIGFWLVGTIAVQRVGHVDVPQQSELFSRGTITLLRDLLVGLSAVAGGSVVIVLGFTELADLLGVPEYASSFLILSLGTSLPELFIDSTALRRGDSQLAMGDVVGSSFVDATVSLGIGPALFPVAISSSAAVGSLLAAAIIGATTLFLLSRKVHDRRSAIVLFALYVVAYGVIVV